MALLFSTGNEPVPGYKLVENLGGSGFSRVWKVLGPNGQYKQWKMIDMQLANAAVETKTLSLLVKLRHPRLNTLTNFWQIDDGKVLIIETDFPVMSLADRLQQAKERGSGIPADELGLYMQQAAEGLDFLNSPRHQFEGKQVAVYHRALRPECLHVFVEGGKQVCKVSDFGLAKPVAEQVSQHSQGLQHYDYDPPEFFEGQTTPTSDQYSLAIVYYQLRSGELPFKGTMLDQLAARLEDRPNLQLIEEPERGVVKKALSKEPAQRFPNCQAFVKQLRSTQPAGGASAATPAGRPAPSRASAAAADAALAQLRRAAQPEPAPEMEIENLPEYEPVAEEAPAPRPPVEMPGVVYHRRQPGPEATPAMAPAASSAPPRTAPAASDTQRLKNVVKESRVAAGVGASSAPEKRGADVHQLRRQLGTNVAPQPEPDSEPEEFKIPIGIAFAILIGIAAVGAAAAYLFM